MKTFFLILFSSFATILFAQSTIIGTTTYDLQTNACSRNRIQVYDDGSISAIWTGGTSFGGSWPERGMFYNHFNGVSWNPAPTSRIETVRTGFGELMKVMDHEVVLAHDGTNLQLFANAIIGGTTWTELPGSEQITGIWAVTDCPSGTDDIYVICPDITNTTQILFSRSDNGGNSWTVLESPLPFLTEANGFDALTAEVYQIQVKGSHVYIIYGSSWSDLVLLHSPSKGNPGTWSQMIINDFPIDNYDGELGEDSDYDGDGDFDTINTIDGFNEMILTNSGVIHFFSANYMLLDDNPTTEGWSYFPRTSGLLYWNSTMTEPTNIDLLIDWNNVDGLNDPFAGIGTDLGMYDGVSFTSMVGAAIDEATGYIYLVYAMPIEYTDWFGDPTVSEAQSFRDLFGVYSADNGATWSAPINLTNTAELHQENVFPMVYDKAIDGKVHVIWMQDEEPGTSLDVNDFDPIGINNIRYEAFDGADFGIEPPCNFTEGPTGLFAEPIAATSVQLHWDAVPGADKYQVLVYQVSDPAIKFKKKPATNMANILGLTPETDYAFKIKTICPGGIFSPYSATSFFTTGPLREGEINNSIIVYPNPSNGNFTIQLPDILNTNVEIKVMDAVGKIILVKNVMTTLEDQEEKIDIAGVSSGIYYFQVMYNGVVNTGKVVIE